MTEPAQTSGSRVSFSRAVRGIRRNPSLLIGAFLVGLVGLCALLSLVWLPADPNASALLERLKGPSLSHALGTDSYGRDLLARVLVGSRSALEVGVIALSLGLLLGVPLGMVAGYFGGWLDRVFTLLLEALYAFPTLLLVLLLVTAWGAGLVPAMVAVGISAVPVFARIARAGTLTVRQEAYLEAARALGAPSSRILMRHILPNILGPLLVQSSFTLGAAILIEGALSYLGLGVQPPQASWGNMLREAQSYLSLSPYPTVFPGFAIVLSVLGFNLLGDGLRDALDRKSRGN